MPTKNSSTSSATPVITPVTPDPNPAAPAAATPVITSVSRTKVAAEVSFQTLVTGLPAVFAGELTFDLPSGTYTLAELTAPFQRRIAAAEATKAAEIAYHDAVAAEKPIVAESDARRKEVKQLAVGRFGAKSSVLAQLGFTPEKPRKVSAATKAGSAAKSAATRKSKKAATAEAPATPAPTPKPGA